MKLKILHILHSLRIGGLENGAINLINRLDDGRFEHSICCIDESGPMAKRLIRPVDIYALGKGERRDHLLPFKIASIIRKVKPDIVHTRNWGTIDGAIAAHLSKVRYVVHGEHGREAADPDGANKRRSVIRKALNPLISRFVTVSSELRDWLVRDVGISQDKVIQIINGVDTERFRPAGDKAIARSKTGFDPDSFLIGTVGRLDPVKDMQTLIDTIHRLTFNISNKKKIELLIVGSGPEEQKLKARALELQVSDRIYFIGERNDIPELMQAMDVFVLPSIAEGISNTLLEAMASGLPIVATRVGGNPEVVEDGVTGVLFEPGNSVGFAEKLFLYSSNPELARKHGCGGRIRAEERFSLGRMVKEYEKLYLSLAGG